jgi:hypothetical protein
MAAREPLPEGTYVVDRNDIVWLIVRDGGMATRATATGIETAGIQWLENTAGPLVPFDPAAYRAGPQIEYQYPLPRME